MALKVAFQVTKQHPYKCDGDVDLQCFMALVREMAAKPAELYRLSEDKCHHHTCPRTGQTFKIEKIFLTK